MSYLSRTFTPLWLAGRALPSRSLAALHTSSARRGLSEDHIHNEDRDKEIERHKGDSVEKAKTGRGEWKPELASQSEQALQGDKDGVTMEQLQKMGEQKAKDKEGSK